MSLDRIFRKARIPGEQERVDIGISAGRFAAIGVDRGSDAPSEDLGGRVVVPGFVETHALHGPEGAQ